MHKLPNLLQIWSLAVFWAAAQKGMKSCRTRVGLLFLRPSILLSINLSIYPSIHLSICPSICPSVHLSIPQASNQVSQPSYWASQPSNQASQASNQAYQASNQASQPSSQLFLASNQPTQASNQPPQALNQPSQPSIQPSQALNEQMNGHKSSCVLLWGCCPPSSYPNSQSCKAGQRVSLTTYCPC